MPGICLASFTVMTSSNSSLVSPAPRTMRLGAFMSSPNLSAATAIVSLGKSFMSELDKVMYTAKTHTTGGREGASRSLDGQLDVKLSRPASGGSGTNPEQLFAAGWSACFLSAMQVVANRIKITLPDDAAVDAEVDLGPVSDAFGLAVRLDVSLPGVEHGLARRLIDATHQVCPYSRATHGNINVTTHLV